jgi:uncharacterized membrane protein
MSKLTQIGILMLATFLLTFSFWKAIVIGVVAYFITNEK